MYKYDFVIVNKSYKDHLAWSVAMHRSYQINASPLTPFYIVVPAEDVAIFLQEFQREQYRGRIGTLPRVISEETIFSIANIDVPEDFGGWHRQQLIKLCFSKSQIARNYLTVDSQILFTRKFDYRDLFDGEQIFTGAHPVSRNLFFAHLRDAGEKGWRDGALVDMGDVLSRICQVMGNNTGRTNSYISCTGMFDSELAQGLEKYAENMGISGYSGLLRICPYEFAWYGEYVFNHHKKSFVARSPHIMDLVASEEQAVAFKQKKFPVRDDLYGIMFQPPATENINPEDGYETFFSRFEGLGVWNG